VARGRLGSWSVSLELEFARFRSEMAKVNTHMQTFARKMDRIGRFAGFGLIGYQALRMGRAVVTAGLDLERMNSAMKTVFGSQQAANSEMTFLRENANRLGLEFQALSSGYAKLAASAEGTTLAGQGVRDIFSSTTEAARALGLSNEEVEGTLRALSQMLSKGKVQAEELRGQLGERLPGAFQDAARAMGVTTGQLDKMLQKGEVLAEDLLPKLAEVLHEKYGKAAMDASEGAIASFGRFNNAIFEIKVALSDLLIPVLAELADWFVFLWEKMKTLAAVAKIGFGAIKDTALDLAGSLGLVNEATTELSRNIHHMSLGEMEKELAVVNERMIGISTSMRAMAEANGTQTFVYKNLQSEMDALADQAEILGDGIQEVEKKGLSFNDAGVITIDIVEGMGKEVKKTSDLFKRNFTVGIDSATSALDRFWDDLHAVGGAIEDNSQTLHNLNVGLEIGALSWDAYSEAMFDAESDTEDLTAATKETVSELFNLKDALDELQGNIQEGFSDLFSDILAGKGIDSFKDFFSKIFDLFKKMLADMAAAWLTSKIFGGTLNMNGGGGFGDFFSGLGKKGLGKYINGGGINGASSGNSPVTGSTSVLSRFTNGFKGTSSSGAGGSVPVNLTGASSSAASALSIGTSIGTPTAAIGGAGTGITSGYGVAAGSTTTAGTGAATGFGAAAGAAFVLAIGAFGFGKQAKSEARKQEANREFHSGVQQQGFNVPLTEVNSFRGAMEGVNGQADALFLTMNTGFKSTYRALLENNLALDLQGAKYDELGNELFKVTGNVEGITQALQDASVTGFETAADLQGAIGKGINQMKVSVTGDFAAIQSAMQAAAATGVGSFLNLQQTATGASATIHGDLAKWADYLQGVVNDSIGLAVNGVGQLESGAQSATSAFKRLAAAASSVSVSGGAPRQGLDTYATGGIANKASIFGEAGPEAAVPLPDGQTIPVTISGGGDGGSAVLLKKILNAIDRLSTNRQFGLSQ